MTDMICIITKNLCDTLVEYQNILCLKLTFCVESWKKVSVDTEMTSLLIHTSLTNKLFWIKQSIITTYEYFFELITNFMIGRNLHI